MNGSRVGGYNSGNRIDSSWWINGYKHIVMTREVFKNIQVILLVSVSGIPEREQS